MKKYLVPAVAAIAVVGSAEAAPMTLGDGMVVFDPDNAVQNAVLIQEVEPCGPMEAGCGPTSNSMKGSSSRRGQANETYNQGDTVNFLMGFDLLTEVRVDDEQVVKLTFANNIVNGAGADILVFEVFNDSDPASLSLTFGGMEMLSKLVEVVNFDIDGDGRTEKVSIFGWDLSMFGLADGAIAGNMFFLTAPGAGDTPDARWGGRPDIAAIIARNLAGDPPPPDPLVPLPAAMPLFLAGLAGLGFARGRRRRM